MTKNNTLRSSAAESTASSNGRSVRPNTLFHSFPTLVLFAVLFHCSLLVAQGSFSGSTDFGAGAGPFSIVIGDLNRDGKNDLAMANNNDNTISILFNTTNISATVPSFSAVVNFAAGSSPRSIATGDLNGDGKTDLVVTNIGNNTLTVFLNTTDSGAMTPSFGLLYTIATGSGPAAVFLGDLNADGKRDIAVTNSDDQSVSIFLNRTDSGAATFVSSPKREFSVGNTPTSVCLGDLNGDGKPDLAVANNNDSTVSVLLNTSSAGDTLPVFTAATNFNTGGGPFSLVIGDVNGDGKNDLAVTNNNNATLSILLNTTAPGALSPTFSEKSDFPTGLSPRSVSFGDVNGDGKVDVAVANLGDHTVSILLNTTVTGSSVSSFTSKSDYPAGEGQRSVAFGDVNGDGKADLATVNFFENSVSVFLNTSPTILPVAMVSFTAAAQTDGVRLEWHTATETDNFGFDVERRGPSRNAIAELWTTIGFVEGAGTVNVPTAYWFIDRSSVDPQSFLPQRSFSYRLKQIDRNGNFAYSPVIEVQLITATTISGLGQNYPNPFNPITVIRYRLAAAGPVSITVFDLLGKTVSVPVNESAAAGEYTLQFNASALPSGLYFYVLRSGSVVETRKMIVVK